MKQNIEIEYTEKEFETVFNFFGSIVTSCSSLAQKVMEMENNRRLSYEKSEKHEKLKSKMEDYKEETNDMFEEIQEDIASLKGTKIAIRDIQKTLAALSLQIESLEDAGDLDNSKHF